MVQGIVVPAFESDPLVVREFARLDDYQDVVGGWIEAVDIPDLGISVYVNDEGLVGRLPFNARATYLWWHHVPAVRGSAMLVGPAVIVGMPDETGETGSIPDKTSEKLTSVGGWRISMRIGGDSQRPGGVEGIEERFPLPLAHGDPTSFMSQAQYEDYFSACAWTMVLRDREPSIGLVTLVRNGQALI